MTRLVPRSARESRRTARRSFQSATFPSSPGAASEAERAAFRPGDVPFDFRPAHSPAGLSRRQSRRTPIHDLLVAIDAIEIAPEPWVVDAIDINSRGMGLVLPPELPEGAPVLLSFKLDEDLHFSRLPATVLHRMTVSGGVRFDAWPAEDRLKLLEYLVHDYETVEENKPGRHTGRPLRDLARISTACRGGPMCPPARKSGPLGEQIEAVGRQAGAGQALLQPL